MDIKIKFFLLVLIPLVFGFVWFFSRERPIRWLVFYGNELSPRMLMQVDLAILEPDNITPSKTGNKKTIFFGYLSLGEVNDSRGYWPEIAESDFVVAANPHWQGAWQVDIRSQKWQKLLLEKVIPKILEKGYQGLFLDSVDMAMYLEAKDPEKFSGSRKAMIDFFRLLHKKFPNLLLVPNNAIELLEDYGDIIYGVVVEDLYTRCDFATRTCGKTPLSDSQYKEERLDAFRKHFKKPVFNILYDYSNNPDVEKYGIKRSEKKKYHWYLTEPSLTQLGTIGR